MRVMLLPESISAHIGHPFSLKVMRASGGCGVCTAQTVSKGLGDGADPLIVENTFIVKTRRQPGLVLKG